MWYHVTVTGAFQLTPPATSAQQVAVAAADRGWRVSPNGLFLFLPDDEHPNVFAGVEFLVAQVFPSLGLAIEGAVTWRGEDGAEGHILIRDQVVTISEPEPEQPATAEVQRLIRQLAEGSEAERLEAAEVFEHFQISLPPVLNALARGLEDPPVHVKTRVANVLASLGQRALPVLESLVAALRQPEPWVQCAAAEAIGAIGPAAVSALPALRELQQHPSYGPRGRATEAIAKLVPALGHE